MSQNLETVLADALEELTDRIREEEILYKPDHYGDMISELADSHVPVYTSEIMALANAPAIYNMENELGGDTLEAQISGRIYTAITQHLYDGLKEVIDEIFPECPICFDQVLEEEIDRNDGEGEGCCDGCQDDLDEAEEEELTEAEEEEAEELAEIEKESL